LLGFGNVYVTGRSDCGVTSAVLKILAFRADETVELWY
jgi:hypothetical protein